MIEEETDNMVTGKLVAGFGIGAERIPSDFLGDIEEFSDSDEVNEQRVMENTEELDNCEDFKKIFTLVKKSVKETMGVSRTGLMLYLADLPLQVGAYYQVGSNGIVFNRALLNAIAGSVQSKRELNAFVYSILLHEYLHALGHLDERGVRALVYKVSRRTFGMDHVATRMAAVSPWVFLRNLPALSDYVSKRDVDIVRDFEQPENRYIV